MHEHRMDRWLSLVVAAAALISATGASCGPGPTPSPARGTQSAGVATDPGAAAPVGDESGAGGTGGGLLAPMGGDALAGRQAVDVPRHEGPAPQIADLDGAAEALSRGYYPEVKAACERLGQGSGAGRAALLVGQAELATGHFAEADAAFLRAARDPGVRLRAETLRGETLMTQGRLDEAERVLTQVAGADDAHRAHLMLGRLLSMRGRAVEAEPYLMRLIDAYNAESISNTDGEGLAYVAQAAWALGSHRDANDAFQEANRADATNVEMQVAWAEMFLEKYDAGHAEESVRVALERNPAYPPALALIARIKLEQSFDFPGATAFTDRALEINPNLVMAHVTRAGMELRDMNLEAADRQLDAALRINPNDLEALSVRAAVRFLADDVAGFAAAKREVLARNRRYGRMYSIIAEYADWEHRYPEIVEMAREAVTLDPNDALAHATLGLNLLRMGDEQEGLAALREAWQRDHYNVHVYNTLQLYDDVIGQQYVEFDARPLVFRMHRDERPVLERYVPPMLTRAYEDMRRRYGFTPAGPVRIELFADLQHFSVRTTGLPNLGVQGVCFGKVVTAISPRGGPFNWGQITWHELAHIFHIQLSRNHVPRWFTEGLAEYETIIARPEWRREEDHRLYRAIADGTLPELAQLNRAFTHARSAQDMMTAYYASSQVVKYIVERFGFDKVVAMLRQWGRGQRTPAIVQQVLGLSIADLDRAFRAQTQQRLAARAGDFSVDLGRYDDLPAARQAAQAAPRDATKMAELAAAQVVAGDVEAARATAEQSLGVRATEPLALYLMARLSMATPEAAEAFGRRLLAAGKDGYEIRLLLTQTRMALRDPAGARRELEAATGIDADRPEAWHGLRELASEGHDAELLLRALRAIVRIDQHDRESAAALIQLLYEGQHWDELLAVAENTLYLDPHRREVHTSLAEAYFQKRRFQDALNELDVAVLIGGEGIGRVHLSRTRAFAALGRRSDARQAAEEAVVADPSLASEARAIGGGR